MRGYFIGALHVFALLMVLSHAGSVRKTNTQALANSSVESKNNEEAVGTTIALPPDSKSEPSGTPLPTKTAADDNSVASVAVEIDDITDADIRAMTSFKTTPSQFKNFSCLEKYCNDDSRVRIAPMGMTLLDIRMGDVANRLCPKTCKTDGNKHNTNVDGRGVDKLCSIITQENRMHAAACRLCKCDH